jgi:hypothetical protein
LSLEQTLGTEIIATKRLLRQAFLWLTIVYFGFEALVRMLSTWVVWYRRGNQRCLAPNQANPGNGLLQPEDMKKPTKLQLKGPGEVYGNLHG